MASSIAKLVVTLGANVSGFETDMARATRTQKKRMQEMERQVQQAGRAIAVAFAAAAGSMAVLVKQSANTADEMQKLSQRTGLSTEALSQYQHVAELSGVSMESFANGIKRMQRSISDADVGLSTQVRAFERLGISVEDLIRLSPEEQFERIAGAISKLESATLRSATAQEVFGRSGTELLSVMASGAEGIQQLREEADKLGLTIGQKFADDAAEFNDNLERMQAAFTGLGRQLTAAVLPALLDLQQYFFDSATSTDAAARAGEKLGDVLKTLTAAFVIVKNAALGFGKVLLGVFDLLLGIGQTTLAPIIGSIRALVEAFAALKSGDLSAAADALGSIGQNIGDQFQAAADRIKNAGGFILDTLGNLDEGLDDVARVFTTTSKAADGASSVFKDTGQVIESSAKKAAKAADAMGVLAAQMKKLEERSKDANKLIADTTAELDDLIEAQENYEQALQDVLDALYPLEAEGRRLGDTLALLTRANQDGTLSWDQYQDAVNRAVAAFDGVVAGTQDAAKGIDLLAVAMDEGARIIERTIQSMFEGIGSSSAAAWDAVLDGFKSLTASIAKEAARGIQIQIQTAFGEGGGGFGSIDWKQAGLNFGAAAASMFADDIVTGIFGGDDYGINYAEIGAQIGAVIGAIVGSFIPVIGTALGAIIGSFAGALQGTLFGKLFGREFGAILGGETIADMENTRADRQVLRSPLADVIGISGQGGFGDLNDPETPGGQIGEAIRTFDQAIFDILKAANASEEFEAIVTALENWKGAVDGGAADLEALLRSRFSAIIGTMGDHVADFVYLAEDLQDQIERFAVALTIDKLFEAAPEALAGRTQAEFLAIIEKYRSGMQTIGEATQEVLGFFSQIVGVVEFLTDFSASDLRSDFSAFLEEQGRTTAQKLAAINSQIFDEVANFDGSIESLQTIAGLVATAREGEIALLMEIDAIQNGINSSLDKLKAEILGLSEGDKTGEQLFLDAQKLIGQITDQSSAADIAAIEQQFNSILRSISPEDQLFMQSEILALIEAFRERANPVLDMRRDDAISAGEDMRSLIDGFLVEIGDPLDILAAALDGDNVQQTMEDGFDRVAQSNQAAADQISASITAAIAQGLNVTVVLPDGGLVTQ